MAKRASSAVMLLAILLLPASLAYGNLTLQCGQDSVGIGESFVVRLVYEGEGSGTFSLNGHGAFRIREGGLGQGSVVFFSDGKMVQKRRLSRDFIFTALHAGVYSIGPGSFLQGGRRLVSNTITIRVDARSSRPRRPSGLFGFSFEGGADDDAEEARYKVETRLSLDTPWVSQEIALYLDVLSTSQEQARLRWYPPMLPGFWVEQLNPNRPVTRDEVVREGQKWYRSSYKLVNIYPTTPGEQTIPAVKGLILTSGFPGNRIEFETPPRKITVRPLPEAGKPEGFSGIVGSWTLVRSRPEGTPVAGQPFQLSVTLAGTGMAQAVTELQLAVPTNLYRILSPRISSTEVSEGGQTNTRRFSYTLYPVSAGVHPLPVFSLDFYDPVTARYRRVSTEPGEVEVGAGIKDGEPVSGDSSGLAALPFVRPAAGERQLLPFSSRAVLVLFSALALVSLGNLLHTRRRLARDADPVGSRRLSARKTARAQLAAAAALLRKGDCSAALSRMEKALKGYVADRLGVAAAGVLYTTLGGQLTEQGMDPALVGDYLAHTARLGDLRYGGAPDAADCRGLLEASRNLLVRLGRGWS